MFSSKRGDL